MTQGIYDLDQGSFTLPIIHVLEYQQERRSTELLSIFQNQICARALSMDTKKLLLKRMHETGSLQFSKKTLENVQADLLQKMINVEEMVGEKN
jgi:streptomycin 6-kinase